MQEAQDKLMTDEELCELLRISKRTLAEHLKKGPPKTRAEDPNFVDVRTLRYINVGGQRRWVKESVDHAIYGED